MPKKKKLESASFVPEDYKRSDPLPLTDDVIPTAEMEVKDLPDNAHSYYVWKDGVFIKYFTNEQHKGDAKKFAQQYADEIGGTVEV